MQKTILMAMSAIVLAVAMTALAGCSNGGTLDVTSQVSPETVNIHAENGNGIESRVMMGDGDEMGITGSVSSGTLELIISGEYSGEMIYDEKLSAGNSVDFSAALPDTDVPEGYHVIIQASDATADIRITVE